MWEKIATKCLILKNLKLMNLENLNLVELNAQEVQETEGGIWLVVLGAIATACIADWDNFERGLKGLPCK